MPAGTTLIPSNDPPTPTPEIFISLTHAIPAQVQLSGITLSVEEASLDECDIPTCPSAPAGTRYLRVPLQALNLPADQFLDYKNLPEGVAIYDNAGTSTPFNRLTKYAPERQRLFLYFTVPQTATVFALRWPGSAEIPLTIAVNQTLPTFEGAEVSVDSLSVVLPTGLVISVSAKQVPRADGQELLVWGKAPGHTEFKMEGYPLQGKTHEPKIYVYPANAYLEMVPAAFESIRRLDNILYAPTVPTTISPDQLPAAPFFNDVQVFASNIQVIYFQNGGGVRSLTEYDQYAASVNNHDLIYHFQGVTRDGAYYIVAILPITAPMIAETSDAGAPPPPGGVPYPYFAEGPNADMQTYYASVIDLLNASPSDVFTPTLNQLDSLIHSMRIAP